MTDPISATTAQADVIGRQEYTLVHNLHFLVQRSSIPGPTKKINWLWCVNVNIETPTHGCSCPFTEHIRRCFHGPLISPKLGQDARPQPVRCLRWAAIKDALLLLLSKVNITSSLATHCTQTLHRFREGVSCPNLGWPEGHRSSAGAQEMTTTYNHEQTPQCLQWQIKANYNHRRSLCLMHCDIRVELIL